MSTKRRVGIVGFGHLGRHLYCHLPRDNFDVAFVWNRTKASLVGQVPDDVILDNLEDFAERKADLIVEVAHPDVTRKFGPEFVKTADCMLGSPTALSDPELMEKMKEAASDHAIYVPSGALWGGQDIRKMDQLGDIKGYAPEEEDEDKEEPCEGQLKIRDTGGWRRQRMSNDIIQELETEYARQPKPSRAEIEKMAARFRQRENNIYAWFYRRRNKELRDSDIKCNDSAEDEDAEAVSSKRATQQTATSLPNKKPKRKNSRSCRFFSKEEQTVLENVFARQKYPGESEIEGLARWFHKDERKVSAWFARRRMKVTKDFVKNIDAETYVTPVLPPGLSPDGVFDDDAKLFSADVPYQARVLSVRYSAKSKDASSRRVPSEDEEEICDVVRVSPPPDAENYLLPCLACKPQPQIPIPVKFESGQSVNKRRESVIQWYSKPSEVEPTNVESADNPQAAHQNSAFVPVVRTSQLETDSATGPGISGTDSAFAPVVKIPKVEMDPSTEQEFGETEKQPPSLVPIEWVLRFPGFLTFNNDFRSGPYLNASVPQWPIEPLNRTYPGMFPQNYIPIPEDRNTLKYNEIQTFVKRE